MEAYHSTEETLSGKRFLTLIQGDYESVFLTDCTIEGPVDFRVDIDPNATHAARYLENLRLRNMDKEIICIGCTFENAVQLEDLQFQKGVFFSNCVFKETARFSGSVFHMLCEFAESTFEGPVFFRETVFHDKAIYRQIRCQHAADFYGAQFLGNAVFRSSVFTDVTRFNAAVFSDGLDCLSARFSETVIFSEARFLGEINFTAARFAIAASCRNVSYIENTLYQGFYQRWSRENKRPTEFYLDSEDINEVLNPFFKRYVADQQFIRAFKEQHPFWAWIWRWSSDYGRSLGLWALWSLLIALSFALLYMLSPEWMPEWTHKWRPRFHQVTGSDVGAPLTFWKSFYFSIVTFTTLGFGDVVADNTLARIFVTLEVIFGYIMLGGLISIFANKLASRG